MKKAPAIKNNNKQLGFTLIELMLVISVVGILAIVSVPKYRSITDYYHLQSSVQTITSFIKYAKHRALDEHVNNYVLITKSATLSTPANTVQVLNPYLEAVQSQSLDAGVTLDSASHWDTPSNPDAGIISFNNRGYLVTDASGDTASFKLKSSSNRTVEIQIDFLGNVTTIWN